MSSDLRSARDLQWTEVCEGIATYALSDAGRKLILAIEPAQEQSVAELRLEVMAEVLELADSGFVLPAGEFYEISDALLRVERGASASGPELARVRGCLHVGLRLDRFGAAHEERASLLSRMLVVESGLAEIKRSLDVTIDESGQVLDEASTELARARREVRKVRDEIKSKMSELIARYRDALQDGYFAEREGRYVLPVRADAPYRVDGLVFGTSGSGSTLYVEPQELGTLGNRLRICEGEVERQVAIVLGQLSEQLAPHTAELKWVEEVCGRADLLHSCAQFAQRIGARVVPFGEPGQMRVKSARHPLLCLQLDSVVPSDLNIGSSQALILSGPNAGGKTVALKTIGLLAMMQASGLPVPVAEESSIGFFDEILCDIGDDQSLLMSLSSFSGHVERVVAIAEDAGHGSLVLFDELMAGTDPDEGAALAIATVEALAKAGASLCVTTHYEALKEQAASSDCMMNGAVGFDFDKMEPTFKVTMGHPGASSALIVAERFGLPHSITKRAEQLLPEELIKERKERISLEQVTAQLQAERVTLRVAQQEQEELNRRLALELARQKESHKRELSREGDALRAEVKAARAEIRRVQMVLKSADKDQLAQLQNELDRAARVDAMGSELHRQLRPAGPVEGVLDESKLFPGVKVTVSGFSSPAEVIEAPRKGSIRVLLGVMKMTVALRDVLGIVGSAERSPSLPRSLSTQRSFPTLRSLPNQRNVKSSKIQSDAEGAEGDSRTSLVRSADITLDLRGQRVDEALTLADQFIDELLRNHELGGFALHGHGTGALKESIRTHLRAHPCVASSRAADRDEGGDAFTLFWMAI